MRLRPPDVVAIILALTLMGCAIGPVFVNVFSREGYAGNAALLAQFLDALIVALASYLVARSSRND